MLTLKPLTVYVDFRCPACSEINEQSQVFFGVVTCFSCDKAFRVLLEGR